MTTERTELQGETLAFYFLCGVFCLIGRGSWFLVQAVLRLRATCMDWHCWCPTVCAAGNFEKEIHEEQTAIITGQQKTR
jgi:hypothetical protein